MDYKSLRLAVTISATAVVLIILAVFAANRGSTGHKGAESAAVTETDEKDVQSETEDKDGGEYLTVVGESFRAYGEQIGNQPKAFLYDESFFDPMRDVAVINDGDEEELFLTATALEDTIHVSVTNSRGGLESGEAFQVEVTAMRTGTEKTWTDTDRDGQIDITGQANGSYRVRLLETLGYRVQSSSVTVTVDVPEKPVKPVKDSDEAVEAGTANSSETGAEESAGTGGSIESTTEGADSSEPPDEGNAGAGSSTEPVAGEGGQGSASGENTQTREGELE